MGGSSWNDPSSTDGGYGPSDSYGNSKYIDTGGRNPFYQGSPSDYEAISSSYEASSSPPSSSPDFSRSGTSENSGVSSGSGGASAKTMFGAIGVIAGVIAFVVACGKLVDEANNTPLRSQTDQRQFEDRQRFRERLAMVENFAAPFYFPPDAHAKIDGFSIEKLKAAITEPKKYVYVTVKRLPKVSVGDLTGKYTKPFSGLDMQCGEPHQLIGKSDTKALLTDGTAFWEVPVEAVSAKGPTRACPELEHYEWAQENVIDAADAAEAEWRDYQGGISEPNAPRPNSMRDQLPPLAGPSG